MVVPPLPDLTMLRHAQKDAPIVALREQTVSLTARFTALEQRLDPPRTPHNASLPPSKGQKPNRTDTSKPAWLRKGECRSLMAEPDQAMSARAAGGRHCGMDFGKADQQLHRRYDKIELLRAGPMVTRGERVAGQCPCCAEAAFDDATSTILARLGCRIFSVHNRAMPICGRSAPPTSSATASSPSAGDTVFAPRMKALLMNFQVLDQDTGRHARLRTFS